jgi:hypothetical protein
MIGDGIPSPSAGDPLAPCQSSDVVKAQVGARAGRPRGVRRRAVAVATGLILALLVPAVSYARALTYPGSATWQMRSVEWLREHGGSPLVDRIENR